jgi:hypothetical protein
VRHWLQAGTAPTWHKGERARITDPFVPYLVRRLEPSAVATDAARLDQGQVASEAGRL